MRITRFHAAIRDAIDEARRTNVPWEHIISRLHFFLEVSQEGEMRRLIFNEFRRRNPIAKHMKEAPQYKPKRVDTKRVRKKFRVRDIKDET